MENGPIASTRGGRGKPNNDAEHPNDGGKGSNGGPSTNHGLPQTQGRKRKGSLRKAAILGTRKLLRDRMNSSRTNSNSNSNTHTVDTDPKSLPEETTSHGFTHRDELLEPPSDSGSLASDQGAESINSTEIDEPSKQSLSDALLVGLVGTYISTTEDDDDGPTFLGHSTSTGASYSSVQSLPPGPTVLFHRRRSDRPTQHSSLAIVETLDDMELEEEYDYSDTEFWGWVLLFATWMLFVVVMGSCLGVWSWAWDVGETPYAPPELEDDPTLPIPGYYPALMVCTAVVAWVWVVVAWVGMKFFRHSEGG